MNEDVTENILNWFAKADEDLHATEILFKHEPESVLSIIGFHCQQSIEKYLKAFLIYKEQDFNYVHNLNYLQNLCSEFDPDFKEIEFKNLNRFAVEQRYPDETYELEVEEAREYLSLAHTIKSLVRSKILF